MLLDFYGVFFRFGIIAATALVAACTAPGALMLCADSALPRPITHKTYEVMAFAESGALLASSTIICEKYYDADCSVRGNHYAYRRLTPLEKPFVINLDDGNILEVTFPGCKSLMVDGEIHAYHFGREYLDRNAGLTYSKIYYYKEGVMADGRKGFMFHNASHEAVWLGEPFTATIHEVVKE